MYYIITFLVLSARNRKDTERLMPSPLTNHFRRAVPPLFFLLLTLVAVHPLPWRMADEVLHSGRDQLLFLWDLWWVNHAITVLHQSPFETWHLFAPEGVSLSYHTLCSASGFFGILLGSKANLVLANNVLLLLTFVLGGWFAYLLVRELSGSRGGACFGAILFIFGPSHWYPIYRGQMHIYTTQWMLLFLLAMVWYIRKPKWQTATLMSVSLATVFYTGYQQVVFTFMLAALILPFMLPTIFRKNDRFLTRRMLAGAILFTLLLLVLVSPLALEMWRHGDEARIKTNPVEWHTMAVNSERLLSGTRYYREWTELEPGGPFAGIWRFLQGVPPNSGPVLGFVAVLLILAGWFSLILGNRRGALCWPIVYWSLALIPFVWIMLGPEPSLFGIRIPSVTPLLQALPGFQSIRSAIRYAIPLSLVAAVLSGFIAARFHALFDVNGPDGPGTSKKGRRVLSIGLSVLAVAALYLEFLRIPVKTALPPKVPATFRAGGAVHLPGSPDADPGILLEVPYWYAGGGHESDIVCFYMLYHQTVHQRPMAGGHVSRLIPSVVPESINNPVLKYLSRRKPSRYPEPSPEQAGAFCSSFDVKFINVSLWVYKPEDRKQIRSFLEHNMGAILIHEDIAFQTFEIAGEGAHPQ